MPLTFAEAVARYPHAPGDPDVHRALFDEIERLRAENALLRRDIVLARCDARDAETRAMAAWLEGHERRMAAVEAAAPQPGLPLSGPAVPVLDGERRLAEREAGRT
jgi:hypothetical protein